MFPLWAGIVGLPSCFLSGLLGPQQRGWASSIGRGPPIRSRSPERKHDGSPIRAQTRCRSPPIRPRSPEKKDTGLGSHWAPFISGLLNACGFHRPGLSDLAPRGSCKQVNGQSKKSVNSPTFPTEPCGTGRILACICEASLRTSCKLCLQTILDCLPRAQAKVYSKAIPSGRVWSWPTACIRSPAFRFDCLSECDTFRLRKTPYGCSAAVWQQS